MAGRTIKLQVPRSKKKPVASVLIILKGFHDTSADCQK
jgi:hypothetical protein